jgi:hypothetical protein
MEDKLDLLMWAIGGGFAGTWAFLWFLTNQIKSLDEKLTDVDRRLCRLEGAFYRQECCVIKDHHIKEKAL